MKVQRINMDTSWLFYLDGLTFLIDPWLVGSEIDGFSWFNEQWHKTEPIAPNDLPHIDYIVYSQNYEDHCHLPTLALLPSSVPIIATEKAAKKVRKAYPNRAIIALHNNGDAEEVGAVSISAFKPNRNIDPIYYGLSFTTVNHQGLFYCPHGFEFSKDQKSRIKNIDYQLLITTFTHFQLPSILGGVVNPGMENVVSLFEQLTPNYVINTHDEEKIGKGLVSKIAKVKYADYEKIEAQYSFNFIHLRDYKVKEIV